MQDTPKEAATGDKAARDLMISEKKYIIGANRAGKSTFFTNIQNFFEIQKKEIEKLQTELIKEKAVNAKLVEVLKDVITDIDWTIPVEADTELYELHCEVLNVIKQAEALNGI